MSTGVLESPVAVPQVERLLTVADVAALPDELPSGAVRYELNDGRLVVMPPAGDIHGEKELRNGAELLLQGERRGFGKARSGEVGIVLRRNPDRLVGADALFVCNSRLPLRRSPEGYLETIPDLVVEVRSISETQTHVDGKVAEYLAAGVRLVWVIDPRKQTITAYCHAQSPQIFGENETLTANDVIPGFAVSVSELFQD